MSKYYELFSELPDVILKRITNIKKCRQFIDNIKPRDHYHENRMRSKRMEEKKTVIYN